ncbi:signal peptidase, endoplasmic reticulum-type [Geodermatophilus africanus]|uniref:Signal peptidase I n=1 Tax=Geodermatophilus africanus TaxID=1137993 RepID=A0A1H3BQW8_9ACTN|nr:signal peptidase I [Geodermatophilus africanus]SDX44362.1 signal peptidase, endoplasmic reticulum-type [Geodermatophilus africanus]
MPSPASAPDAPTCSLAVHTVRRVVSWVLGLVLLAGTGAALGVVVYPVVTGGAALAVLTGSMTPGLPVGAMVFTKPVTDPAALRVGDVITFVREPGSPELVTHRIIAVDDSGDMPVFATQGDANNAPDLDPVPASSVRGELWFSVAELGRAAAVLHSPKGLGFLVVLVCAVLAVAPGPEPERKRPEDTAAGPTGEPPATARADVDTVHVQLVRPAVPPSPARIGLLD